MLMWCGGCASSWGDDPPKTSFRIALLPQLRPSPELRDGVGELPGRFFVFACTVSCGPEVGKVLFCSSSVSLYLGAKGGSNEFVEPLGVGDDDLVFWARCDELGDARQ